MAKRIGVGLSLARKVSLAGALLMAGMVPVMAGVMKVSAESLLRASSQSAPTA